MKRDKGHGLPKRNEKIHYSEISEYQTLKEKVKTSRV